MVQTHLEQVARNGVRTPHTVRVKSEGSHRRGQAASSQGGGGGGRMVFSSLAPTPKMHTKKPLFMFDVLLL